MKNSKVKQKCADLLKNLEIDYEWAIANEWESPICLADDIKECYSLIKTVIMPYINKQSKEICECYKIEYGKAICYGTKEREECSCGGDKNKCNFY